MGAPAGLAIKLTNLHDPDHAVLSLGGSGKFRAEQTGLGFGFVPRHPVSGYLMVRLGRLVDRRFQRPQAIIVAGASLLSACALTFAPRDI